MEALVAKIREIIIDVEVIVDEMNNLDSEKSLYQGIDSLDMASILLGGEEKYELKFPDEKLDKFQIINPMIASVYNA